MLGKEGEDKKVSVRPRTQPRVLFLIGIWEFGQEFPCLWLIFETSFRIFSLLIGFQGFSEALGLGKVSSYKARDQFVHINHIWIDHNLQGVQARC